MNLSNHSLAKTLDPVSEQHAISLATSQPAPQWFDTTVTARQGSSLATYLEIPFMNKRLILACLLMGILCGWFAILVWPRSYESVAKLKLKVGRENVALDPTAGAIIRARTPEGR